jgi:hypothetical protein
MGNVIVEFNNEGLIVRHGGSSLDILVLAASEFKPGL